MSVLSDDTDVLLLIPPDFFFVPSDTEEDSLIFNKAREKWLVGDLISQVNDLEGRVCHIENHGTISKEKILHNESLQHARYFGSADALNTSNLCHMNTINTQSSPLKTQTLPCQFMKKWKDHLNLSPSKSKCVSQKNKLASDDYLNKKDKDGLLLKEVNMFFNDRETFRGEVDSVKRNMAQSGVTNPDDCPQLSTTVFNLNKVNDLLKQLEETQAEIELKLKAKGLAEVKEYDMTWRSPEKGMTEKNSAGKHLDLDRATPVSEGMNLKGGMKMSEHKENVNAFPSVSPRKGDEVEQMKLTTDVSGLLSLSKLWADRDIKNSKDITAEDDLGLLRQKYQEEFYRRQHCEEFIQSLQVRMLEDEQKMAVAIRVDLQKDEIISKLTEGWNNIAAHWRLLESQSKSLEKETAAERERFAVEVDAARKTVTRFETELSKALDLAHGYKDKCEALEEECKRLRARASDETESLKAQLKDLERKLQVDQSKSEKLLADTEKKLSEAKGTIKDMQSTIQDNKKCLREHQNQLEIVRVERERLSDKLREEKKRTSTLEHTNKIIIQNCEELKKKEKCLMDNVKVLNEQMDKVKMDLKEFYQAQVEQIVQEKLREFQEQLSVAEKTLHKGIEDREKKVTDMAVKQVQQIVEKHVVEVNILEEKHREEIELWKVRVFRSEEKMADLQRKLDQYSSQKSEIAQKLQSIMEAQWQEALKIITASSPQSFKSPLASCKAPPLSRQNTFTMTSNTAGDVERDVERGADLAFSQEGQLTCRSGIPLVSDPDCDPDGGDSLRKYIRMLLERPPGEFADNTGEADGSAFPIAGTHNGPMQWQQILSECSARDNQKPLQNADDL